MTLGILLLFTALPVSAGVYFWTDENGVKHYSNVAPSESDQKVQRLEEIPPNATDSGVPTEPVYTEPARPAAADENASGEESAGPNPEPENESAKEGGRGTSPEAEAGPSPVPTDQNEIVESEKSVVRELQRQLEQNASQRNEFIEKERQRLTRALEQLQKTPLSEFGSLKNKNRAMGYYRYRLEALENSPDSYFSYADSDTD
jgi:hypothetical protein